MTQTAKDWLLAGAILVLALAGWGGAFMAGYNYSESRHRQAESERFERMNEWTWERWCSESAAAPDLPPNELETLAEGCENLAGALGREYQPNGGE